MRCLVTGVAGFIGSHLAERLVAEGHEVVGVDMFVDYYPRLLKESNLTQLRASAAFEFIEADLNDLDLETLLGNCDWVFHQAAQAGVRASWGRSFDIYVRCNVSATQRLLEAAVHSLRLRRFVYSSSSSVYGDAESFPVTERTPTRPISPYGVTKLAAEHLCALYWRNYHVPTVSLRYFTVYGPRHRPDMAFHRFGKALLLGEEATMLGDGHQTRDFTYVSDVVEANMLAASAANVEGLVFNIAGGSRVSMRDVVETLQSLAGRELRVRYEQPARGDVHDTCADISLAQSQLGYVPRVRLREGLRAELAYLDSLYTTTPTIVLTEEALNMYAAEPVTNAVRAESAGELWP